MWWAGGLFLLACMLAGPVQGEPTLDLELVISNLVQPLFLTHAGDGSGRLFLVEQGGVVRVYQEDVLQAEPLLDLRGQIATGGERGLLGLAFHPDFAANRRFFVNYTLSLFGQLRTVVAEYRVSAVDPGRADSEEKVILEFEQPFSNHNGGMLAFGPDGFLYVGTGDGGSAGDPLGNGQNPASLLGKILRLDVDNGDPYAIPVDNPWAGQEGVRGEIWALGLRNPWRFSFDRGGGRLLAGDVGQGDLEEVDLIRKGGNYGWSILEGSRCFPVGLSGCDTSGLVPPIHEYDRSRGRSVTGGYVYRGTQETQLRGNYLFGDFGSGRIWSLIEGAGGLWRERELLKSGLSISSFGEDEEGELYVLDHAAGQVYRLIFGWRELFAQAADGSSPAGTLRSILTIVNNGDSGLSATLRFVSSEGNQQAMQVDGVQGEEFPFTLEPRSALSLTTGAASDPLFTGWAEVRGDRPFGSSILYQLLSPGGEPLAEAGIASSSPALRVVSRVSRGARFDTNAALALANPSETDAVEVSLSLSSGEDPPLGTVLDLAPRQQRALFLHEIAEIPPDFEGVLAVEASGEVVATLLRTRAGIHSSSLPLIP